MFTIDNGEAKPLEARSKILQSINADMRLFDSAKEISGRTKVQKVVYILQTMGFPFREDYKYHLHGPYSAALTHEVSRLVHLEILEETHQEVSEARVNRFTYKATPDLREILAEFEPSVPDGVRG